jgi:4-hydroxy-2-oxoheptanedioate aldolase
MAQLGWDWIVVDAQHSAIGYENMVRCFQAITGRGPIPMARVSWNDPVSIMRVLDAGAMGIVVPMVNSKEEAEHAVGASKYAPTGFRSSGGSRIAPYVGDYFTWANQEILVVVMIETIQAVEQAEEILSVPGVDTCLIGPSDLAASLGFHPQEIPQHPEHEEAIQVVLAAAKATGTPAGKVCHNPQEVRKRAAQGFQFLSCSGDVRFMLTGASSAYSEIADLLQE